MGFIKSRNELIGCKNIRLFICGGKGRVFLQAPSGKFHVYQFREPLDPDNFTDWRRFVFSRDNDGVWKYCGMLTEDMIFHFTRKSKFDKDSEEFKGAAYIVKMASSDFKTPMKVYHGGRCSVCGKPIRNKYSLEHGMGYRCRKHLIEELESYGLST